METAIDIRKRQLAAFSLLGGLLPVNVLADDSNASDSQGPITLVVGYPPGGATDTLARLLATHFARQLGQNVVVENRPGAASNIAADAVSRAAPDGRTLYIGTRSNTIHKAMYSHFDFDMSSDFAAIALLARMPNVMVTSAQGPIASIGDVIALAKAHPGILTYASTGVASDTHLLGELFQRESRTKLLHVPYRGGAAAMVDVVGGRIDLLIFSLAGALPYLKKGSVRAIAVMAQQRVPLLPDVPTMEESGILGVDLETWFGLLAPSGTSPARISELNEHANHVLLHRRFQSAFMTQGYVAPLTPNTPGTFANLIAEEAERWTSLIRERGIKPA
ncbi:MFS transporter [Bordetella sputigena]|uniref:Bug family tripartite tricarboxylate transporter substrate binding protein n=1 Tax=Bordetella sputigena TaxID=1416810 RepID=UPI0039F13A04